MLVRYAEEKRAEAASQQEKIEVREESEIELLCIGDGVCYAVSGEREQVTGSESDRSEGQSSYIAPGEHMYTHTHSVVMGGGVYTL